MRKTLTQFFSVVACGVLATLALACSNPPPRCAPGTDSYRICSDDQVWECPVGTAAQIAAKQQIEDDCQQETDPIQCLLDAEFEMVDMSLIADCAEGGQVCVSDPMATPRVAQCQDG